MTVTGEGQWLRPPSGSGPTSFSACRIYLDTAVNPAGNLSVIPFDTSDLDTDGYADLAFNRIVIPTGFAGWFRFTVRIGVSPTGAMTTGFGEVRIRTIASGTQDTERKSWDELTNFVSFEAQYRMDWVATLSDGDIIYCSWQNSTGVSVFIQGGNSSGAPAPGSYLEVVRLGDA